MNNKALLCLCATGFVAGALAWQQASVKLPPPYATPSVNNGPRVIPQPNGAKLQVPAGFNIQEYATGFDKPRFMLLGPGNELLLADSADRGTVYILFENGKARKKLIEGLDRPYGMAFWKDYLYVAETTSLKRYKYDKKAMSVGAGEEIVPMKDFARGHWTRSIIFDPKGEKFYLGVGSASNVNAGEPAMRAAINRFNPDGSGHEIFARARAIRSVCRCTRAHQRSGRPCRNATRSATIWCRITCSHPSRAASMAGLMPTSVRMKIQGERARIRIWSRKPWCPT